MRRLPKIRKGEENGKFGYDEKFGFGDEFCGAGLVVAQCAKFTKKNWRISMHWRMVMNERARWVKSKEVLTFHWRRFDASCGITGIRMHPRYRNIPIASMISCHIFPDIVINRPIWIWMFSFHSLGILYWRSLYLSQMDHGKKLALMKMDNWL